MYPPTRLVMFRSSPILLSGYTHLVAAQICLLILSFFALPAFLYAQLESQPYENSRFLKTYATLQQPSSQILENVSLRNALKIIESSLKTTIWLDRRIDGEQIVQLNPGVRAYHLCLQELTAQTQTEIAWLENILYIAPLHQSPRIETAYWKLVTDRACEVLKRKGPVYRWDKDSDIKSIFEQSVRAGQLKLEGLDRLEHDLWSPAIIPEASLAAQWTCLLSGFNRTLQPKGRQSFQVVELPEASDVEFEYATQLQKIPPNRIQAWKAKWPNAKTSTPRKGKISVLAPVEAHRELIVAGFDSKIAAQIAAPNFAEVNYTLDYDGELEKLIDTLRRQLNVTIEPWPLPAELAKKRIQINVKEVAIDRLLSVIAQQCKTPIKRLDKKIIFD